MLSLEEKQQGAYEFRHVPIEKLSVQASGLNTLPTLDVSRRTSADQCANRPESNICNLWLPERWTIFQSSEDPNRSTEMVYSASPEPAGCWANNASNPYRRLSGYMLYQLSFPSSTGDAKNWFDCWMINWGDWSWKRGYERSTQFIGYNADESQDFIQTRTAPKYSFREKWIKRKNAKQASPARYGRNKLAINFVWPSWNF